MRGGWEEKVEVEETEDDGATNSDVDEELDDKVDGNGVEVAG